MIKPDRIVSTTCPYCGVGCNLQLHVKDDFIFKVTSPFDSPVNHGNLCVKGRFGYDYIYHPKRVTAPLVRRYLLEGGPKPEGREQVFAVSKNGQPIEHSQISNDWDWIETDWDTALDITAKKLGEARDFYGADRDCPLAYEPSGEDFLSPCLAEADLMRRLLPAAEFAGFLAHFYHLYQDIGYLGVLVKSVRHRYARFNVLSRLL